MSSRRSRTKCHWDMAHWGTDSEAAWTAGYLHLVWLERVCHSKKIYFPHFKICTIFFFRERIESRGSGNLRLAVGFPEVVEGWNRQRARGWRRQTDGGIWESMLPLTNGNSIARALSNIILEFPFSKCLCSWVYFLEIQWAPIGSDKAIWQG